MSPATATPIYLDHAATTPCSERVVSAMLPWFGAQCGNTSNRVHAFGRHAMEAVTRARVQVADGIGAALDQLVFTSGATEANNLVIHGLMERAIEQGSRRTRIVVSAIEHRAVMCPALATGRRGFEVVEAPVTADGVVDLAALEVLVDDQTLLVCVHGANNEIGTIQPIAEVTRIAHRAGALMLCDCAQVAGKEPLDVGALNVDFATFSAHKHYGPQGVGALYLRDGVPGTQIEPLILGGGHECGMRSGTHNVPGIVGYGESLAESCELMEREAVRLTELRDKFEKQLAASLTTAGAPPPQFNGANAQRVCSVSSVTLAGCDGAELVTDLPQLAISRGAACSSAAHKPSHVLTALGLSEVDAFSTLRISMGRSTGDNEVGAAVEAITGAVAQ